MEENLRFSNQQALVPKLECDSNSPFESRERKMNDLRAEADQDDEMHLRCQDVFDSDDEAFQNDFFGEFRRPKSSGTIPKSRKYLSSNMSDPCLLTSGQNDADKNLSVENKSTGDHSTNSEINSLDSGIPDDGSQSNIQVNFKWLNSI